MMWKKTHDWLTNEYDSLDSSKKDVPNGFYSVRHDQGQILGAIKTVMSLDGSEQIIEILEQMYDNAINILNADLELKKVPKEMRFKRSYH